MISYSDIHLFLYMQSLGEQKARILLMLHKESAFDAFTKDIIRKFIFITTNEHALGEIEKQCAILASERQNKLRYVTKQLTNIIQAEIQPHLDQLDRSDQSSAAKEAEAMLSTFS